MLTTIGHLWRGEVPLAIAFWHYAVVGGLVMNLVTTGAALTLLASSGSAAWAAVIFTLHWPYGLFMAMAVWRSADRYDGPRRWADLARPAVVAWAILMALT